MKVVKSFLVSIGYNHLKIVFYFTKIVFAKSGQIGSQIGGQIDISNITDRQKEILDLIKQNNKISRKMISEILDINQSAVLKHLNTLKQKGILTRVNGTRGYWEIKI